MESLTLELRVENKLAEISRVNERFNAFCIKNAIPDSTRRKFNTVFDELLNNIISYAFQEGRLHIIHIYVTYEAPKIIAQISDDGIPFNLFEAAVPDLASDIDERPIGGLGIHMVRQIMDEYFYEWNNNRNWVTLVKIIESKEAN